MGQGQRLPALGKTAGHNLYAHFYLYTQTILRTLFPYARPKRHDEGQSES